MMCYSRLLLLPSKIFFTGRFKGKNVMVINCPGCTVHHSCNLYMIQSIVTTKFHGLCVFTRFKFIKTECTVFSGLGKYFMTRETDCTSVTGQLQLMTKN